MDCGKIGRFIYTLRREKGLTQKQLAQQLYLSDKTISKWERGLGCPDIALLTDLAEILGVNIEVLLTGEQKENRFVGGDMKKINYYVCPLCGNFVFCTGEASVSCCGRKLEVLEAKKADATHQIQVETVEDEWYLTTEHPMTKEHYFSFVAFATGDKIQVIKQYPEWNLQVRIPKRGHGKLLWYCTEHGLFYQLL